MKTLCSLAALATLSLSLPLSTVGCSSDGGNGDPGVEGDPGQTAAEAAEGSSSVVCTSDNATTPECVQLAADMDAAVAAMIGAPSSTQTADDSDLELENTGSGSKGTGGKGSTGSGGSDEDAGAESAPAPKGSSNPGSGSTTSNVTRQQIIARAKSWVAAKVMYSQTQYHQGFRQDCSGFVSMAWQISSNPNTAGFAPYSKSVSSQLSNYSDLLPGDALNKQPREHIILFAGWANSAHTSMYIYEESHTGAPALYTTVAESYFKSFVPIRKHGL